MQQWHSLHSHKLAVHKHSRNSSCFGAYWLWYQLFAAMLFINFLANSHLKPIKMQGIINLWFSSLVNSPLRQPPQPLSYSMLLTWEAFQLTLGISPNLHRWLSDSHTTLPFFTKSSKWNLHLLTVADKPFQMHVEEKSHLVGFHFSKKLSHQLQPSALLPSPAQASPHHLLSQCQSWAGRCCVYLLSEQLSRLVGTDRWLLWDISKRGKNRSLSTHCKSLVLAALVRQCA